MHHYMPRSGAGFHHSRRNLKDDEPWLRRPSEAAYEVNCPAVENIVKQNRRVGVQLIADVGISTNGSVEMILHVRLLTTKVCA